MSKIMAAIAIGAALAAPISDSVHATSHHTGKQALVDGEVRKIDREGKKVTIRHGPIAHLDMPAMTMVFQVRDAAMLEQVRAGDKVRFTADKISGAYTVTRLEVSK